MQNDVYWYKNKVKSQESKWLQAFLVPTESYLNQIEGRKLFETLTDCTICMVYY